ncbi:MAG: FGGY-family carbohydrate kinase [Candidatus Enteromonas sp.]|nr:FGGY-family carbohydrate kinase [Candidatus Enteromonas sp.]
MNQNDSPLMLNFDFGTQSVRVSLISSTGETVGMEKESYTPAYYSPKPGYAEMDPSQYFDYLCRATKRLMAAHEEDFRRVQGISLDCFRDTAVLLDKDKNVIRPSILWLDSRMAKCPKPLPLIYRIIFAIVGMGDVIKMNRMRTAMNWIKENEPENAERCDKYVSISTYFIYRLTGQLRDSAGSYTGHYPLDMKRGRWYKRAERHFKGQVFGIKNSQLCELVPPGEIIGRISKEASILTGLPEGLPILVSGSDKSCETLGGGVIDISKAAISLGTACSVETTTDRYIEPVTFLPGYQNVLPGKYNMDIQIYRGFWMLNWFLKEFAAEQIGDLYAETNPEYYNRQLTKVPPGCEGLLLQPYWGSLLDRPKVKGAIIGFSDSTTRMHIYRSLIEGICFELYSSYLQIKRKLRKPHAMKEIRISGGGAQSDEICQILSDVFGLPVTRVQTIETSSLGAGIAGFLASGVFSTPEEAVQAMVHPSTTFLPNEENRKIYETLYKKGYAKLYPSLKKTYGFLYDWAHVD